jgi:hypothetical protein
VPQAPGGPAGSEVRIWALPGQVRQLKGSSRHGRRLESFEPNHWSDSMFDPPMLLFEDVV